MPVTAITTTPQDITGDFDIQVRGNPDDPSKSVVLQKSLGAGTTNHTNCKVFGGQEHVVITNTGTNSYKLAATVPGVTVEFNQ